MNTKRATTVNDANAQKFSLPAFKQWRKFAGLIDGYQIADEMGLDYGAWYVEQEKRWRDAGAWTLDALELRLMIFLAYRSDYMSGYTYTEHDEIVDSLLYALSEVLDLPYAGIDEAT